MAKTEFEEDDEGLPDTLEDIDFGEEEKEEKAPAVNGAVKPKEVKAKKAEPKTKEVEEAEPELTPEQQGQNLIVNILNRLDEQEERIRNLEAMLFRLKQI